VRVENAMKAVVGVIAALVTFGLAALGLFATQQLSSPANHVAGQAFTDPDESTIAPAAQPTASSTPTYPWPPPVYLRPLSRPPQHPHRLHLSRILRSKRSKVRAIQCKLRGA
jgi:hypothetical protein